MLNHYFQPHRLCKYAQNISTNIWNLEKRRDVKLGTSSLLISNNLTISWLYPLNSSRLIFSLRHSANTLDARGLLARQRWGASERVVFVGERPLAQAVKSFERADPITLPVISPESRFDPGNLIGQVEKRFLQGLLLVKCATILVKPVLQSFP